MSRKCTIFERCYRRFGHVLYGTYAYLLEGRVQQDDGRGFSVLVERAAPLEGAVGRARAVAEDGAPREAMGR